MGIQVKGLSKEGHEVLAKIMQTYSQYISNPENTEDAIPLATVVAGMMLGGAIYVMKPYLNKRPIDVLIRLDKKVREIALDYYEALNSIEVEESNED